MLRFPHSVLLLSPVHKKCEDTLRLKQEVPSGNCTEFIIWSRVGGGKFCMTILHEGLIKIIKSRVANKIWSIWNNVFMVFKMECRSNSYLMMNFSYNFKTGKVLLSSPFTSPSLRCVKFFISKFHRIQTTNCNSWTNIVSLFRNSSSVTPSITAHNPIWLIR